jgi:asparagine synthase (glutamine-hydrolysing)
MADRVPREILTRPKRGFPVPTGAWLRGVLHAPMREALLARDGACRSLFPTEVLTRLLDEHRAGRVDRTEELFALWMFEAWHRALVARPEAEPAGLASA